MTLEYANSIKHYVYVLKTVCLFLYLIVEVKEETVQTRHLERLPGTPVLALTGTADQLTEKVTCSTLAIDNATKLFVSPNRPNLEFEVQEMQEMYKKQIFDSLKGSGTKRVVIATSALSMGVNFPDAR